MSYYYMFLDGLGAIYVTIAGVYAMYGCFATIGAFLDVQPVYRPLIILAGSPLWPLLVFAKRSEEKANDPYRTRERKSPRFLSQEWSLNRRIEQANRDMNLLQLRIKAEEAENKYRAKLEEFIQN